MNISGSTVMITGAASGIGKATAFAFAGRKPASLVLCDIDEPGLAETASRLESLGCDALPLLMDVTDHQSVEQVVSTVTGRLGRLDILVNAAGIGMMGRMECLTLEDWRRVIDINLWGTINTNRAVYPHMLERGSGHIVNIASANGIYAPMPYLGPYATSKFGVVGLSEALMVEGRSGGVRVTCVCPGNVRTPIYENAVIRGFDEGARSLTSMNRLIAEPPEKTAERIARAVERNRFIVVTTPVARVSAFARTHLQGLWFAYTRAFTVMTERMIRRYGSD